MARWTHYTGTMPPQGLRERYQENWWHGPMLPGKNNSDLSESDKQLISNLETIASKLAGGDNSSANAGVQAGKNAAENNA
ncbi:VENN motif pre-toxin domain-containing protein [Lelliottia nimipressuralis]|uniref:VENN motif pre-toxin domain-containing protein n=1 Tax=Lelliottia nimipressuralis TaxID=69220 RepID=UPI002B268FB3|nr:VENN motif pre-toxin domain-containing protein [Lelliottia nimipressuralis]